jgi:hypothetical protein
VSVAGITLPTLVLNQLLPSLDVPIALPALPYGLRVDELRPTQAGLVVLGSAEAVVFRRPAADEPRGDVAVAPRPRPRPTVRDGRPGP